MQAKCQRVYFSLIFLCAYQAMSEKTRVGMIKIIGQLFNCVLC